MRYLGHGMPTIARERVDLANSYNGMTERRLGWWRALLDAFPTDRAKAVDWYSVADCLWREEKSRTGDTRAGATNDPLPGPTRALFDLYGACSPASIGPPGALSTAIPGRNNNANVGRLATNEIPRWPMPGKGTGLKITVRFYRYLGDYRGLVVHPSGLVRYYKMDRAPKRLSDSELDRLMRALVVIPEMEYILAGGLAVRQTRGAGAVVKFEPASTSQERAFPFQTIAAHPTDLPHARAIVCLLLDLVEVGTGNGC